MLLLPPDITAQVQTASKSLQDEVKSLEFKYEDEIESFRNKMRTSYENEVILLLQKQGYNFTTDNQKQKQKQKQEENSKRLSDTTDCGNGNGNGDRDDRDSNDNLNNSTTSLDFSKKLVGSKELPSTLVSTSKSTDKTIDYNFSSEVDLHSETKKQDQEKPTIDSTNTPKKKVYTVPVPIMPNLSSTIFDSLLDSKEVETDTSKSFHVSISDDDLFMLDESLIISEDINSTNLTKNDLDNNKNIQDISNDNNNNNFNETPAYSPANSTSIDTLSTATIEATHRDNLALSNFAVSLPINIQKRSGLSSRLFREKLQDNGESNNIGSEDKDIDLTEDNSLTIKRLKDPNIISHTLNLPGILEDNSFDFLNTTSKSVIGGNAADITSMSFSERMRFEVSTKQY